MVELLSLVGSLGRYVQAMGSLAGEESREAAALGVRLLVMLLAALFFAAFGYILLIFAVAFFAAFVLGISWLWILGGFTILHGLLAYLCARHVKSSKNSAEAAWRLRATQPPSPRNSTSSRKSGVR